MQLIHGDCLEEMRNIPSKSIDMVLADPPYGTTACKWDTPLDLDKIWAEVHRITKDKSASVIFSSMPFTVTLGCSNLKNLKYSWVWEKNHATGHLNAKKRPMKKHEDILVFYRKQSPYFPQGIIEINLKTTNSDSHCRRGHSNVTSTVSGGLKKQYTQVATGYPRSVIKFDSCNGNKIHPTQKPVGLLEYLIKTYTLENETVLDFTMGSGSTGVACKNLNRKFIGIEKEQKYFDIAVKRIKETHPQDKERE